MFGCHARSMAERSEGRITRLGSAIPFSIFALRYIPSTLVEFETYGSRTIYSIDRHDPPECEVPLVDKSMPPRPRLLLADDHVPLLESVRHLLAPAFDVVGVARDGREALELAARVQPDVVVLDVTMPELNGFQTVGPLLQDCPGTKVVFLTMHGEDDFVVEAITAGAHGYVLKSRIHLDLIGAINHALAGRLFVPSLTSLSTVAGNGHAVQFHTGDNDYLDEASRLIG